MLYWLKNIILSIAPFCGYCGTGQLIFEQFHVFVSHNDVWIQDLDVDAAITLMAVLSKSDTRLKRHRGLKMAVFYKEE